MASFVQNEKIMVKTAKMKFRIFHCKGKNLLFHGLYITNPITPSKFKKMEIIYINNLKRVRNHINC